MSLKDTYVIAEGDLNSTFEEDEKLPSLPLPSLSDTLQRYLESVKPFASSDNEYQKTEKVVKAFQEGIGKVLHSKLEVRAQNERNWVSQWWEDYAYLTLREPLLPYYSMVGCRNLPKERYRSGQQIKFASLDCYHYVQLWILLRTEKFKPMKTHDNKPFSMVQYRRLFNCVRVPGQHKDIIRSYFKTEREGTCSSNIVVIKNGYIFVVNGLHQDGTPLTPPEWRKQLQKIVDLAKNHKGSFIPCLSCDYRTSWAKNRDYLLKLGNEQSLSIIESAMFVLCLDDASPDNESQVIHFTLTGDYKCRWPDKSLNMVMFENGVPGGICDHSAFDGIVSMTAMHFVDLALNEDYDFWERNTQVREGIGEPVEVKFIVDSYVVEEIQKLLPKLDIEGGGLKTLKYPCMTYILVYNLITLKNDLQLNEAIWYRFIIIREEFKDFGKVAIQKLKFHPDSFVQMALQLAYYKLHSRPAPCYETGTTRTYYNGRTETVRSCTVEAVTWIKAMLDTSAKSRQKVALLEKAIVKHDQLMAAAKNNEGCDRHLFGLHCVAMEEDLDTPYLYKDPLYAKSGGGGNFVLSTSLTGYLPLGGGVAPMCTEGYGIFYNILTDSICFTISVSRESFETSTLKYFYSLCESLNEMRRILEKHPKAKI